MLNVHPVPALESNYFWLVHPDSAASTAYIIDPGHAAPVISALAKRKLDLAGIIITHRHHDHIDGIAELVQKFQVPVYGPPSPAIPQITHPLGEGDRLLLPDFALEVIAVPGHTLDHIAYIHRPARGEPARLFCGDTLFAGGCGRLFDGSASQLYDSLMRIAALPDDTLVYCAHEYTLDNLRFGAAVEPDNRDLVERLRTVAAQRQRGEITLPTNIGLEHRTNPFLRTHLPSVKLAAEGYCGHSLGSEREIFAMVRIWKDNFRAKLNDNF